MYRAIMMSIGLCLVILGGESLVVDRVVLAADPVADRVSQPYSVGTAGFDSPYSASYDDLTSLTSAAKPTGRVVDPPDWQRWGVLSAGALTLLYASGLSVGE